MPTLETKPIQNEFFILRTNPDLIQNWLSQSLSREAVSMKGNHDILSEIRLKI